jgi:dienelactone hydrolase
MRRLRRKSMQRVLLLLLSAFIFSCSPQRQDLSRKSNKNTIPLPAPIFYPRAEGPFPAILLFPPAVHSTTGENSIARDLAAKGYVARAVDYGDIKFSGLFDDAARLTRFKKLAIEGLASLKAQPGVDPERIGIIGYSMGGYLVTYLASKPDETGLRAGVIYYGTYDVPEEIRNLRIPILAFQGDADHMSSFIRQAIAMKQVAQKHQKRFELVFYTRARHGFDRFTSNPSDKAIARNAWDRMTAFMDQHVKLAHP